MDLNHIHSSEAMPQSRESTGQRLIQARLVRPILAIAAALMVCAAVSAQAPKASAAEAVSQSPATCGAPTPAETEGPYFKAGSPSSSTLAADGMAGTPLHLSGVVLDANCQPIAGAVLEFWQADSTGQYDNSGYTLRRHQATSASGSYSLDTVVPGLYPGRTRHIHVKIQPPGGPVLTTRLYFPNEPSNSADGIFVENGQQLLMNVQPNADGSLSATFNFVVARSG
jgi:protocatechuate 3,4-dioxygenase beta subunit